jgi:hypothetical protein
VLQDCSAISSMAFCSLPRNAGCWGEVHHQVAGLAAAAAGKPARHPDLGARGGFRQQDLVQAVEGRDFDGAARQQAEDAHRHRHVEVVVLQPEERVRAGAQGEVEVARVAAVGAGRPGRRCGALRRAAWRGHRDGELAVGRLPAAPVAGRAAVVGGEALAAAVAAGFEPAVSAQAAAAVAAAAHAGAAVAALAAAVAIVAGLAPVDGDGDGGAVGGLGEVDGDVLAVVGAAGARCLLLSGGWAVGRRVVGGVVPRAG